MVTSNFPFALLTYSLVELQTKWPAIVPFQKIKSVKKPFFQAKLSVKITKAKLASNCPFVCLLACLLLN